MRERTFSPSALCCTKWRPGTRRSAGETAAIVHDAILNRAPVSVRELNPELPAKLEEIINKTVERDRDLRYQHAADIRTDLKRLKRETESSRSAVPVAMDAEDEAVAVSSSGTTRPLSSGKQKSA